MKTLIAITVLLIFNFFGESTRTLLLAQVMQEWVSRYNGTGNGEDYVTDIIADVAGNVYVTGYSLGNGTQNDYTTLKYNSSGDTLWVGRYNGPGNENDQAYSIVLDDSGNVYITGGSKGLANNGDIATIKYDSNGILKWIVRYDAPWNGGHSANSIDVDDLGNIFVAGSAYYSNGHHFIIVKYNSSGSLLWVRSGNYLDNINSMKLDYQGNVIVTGSSIGNGSYFDFVTMKYNSNGDSLWVTSYNGPGNDVDEAYSLDIDINNNVYVTGTSLGTSSGYDYVTIKYNSTGVEQWVQRYNGTANDVDEAYDISVDDSGNVYVTGKSNGQGSSFDFVTIKYNANGIEKWVQRYNGTESAYDFAYSIALDDSGNIYVTGESNSGSPSYVDYATVKYNSAGFEQWVQKYNGPVNSGDYAKVVTVDDSGNVYVAGHSPGIEFNYDIVTIKYSQNITGVSESDNKIPDSYLLDQNYPNPFNPTTTISFSIPNEELVSLKVFNSLGEEVAELVNETKPAGNYTATFDASKLTSGVYLYKISAGSFIKTKKMIYLR